MFCLFVFECVCNHTLTSVCQSECLCVCVCVCVCLCDSPTHPVSSIILFPFYIWEKNVTDKISNHPGALSVTCYSLIHPWELHRKCVWERMCVCMCVCVFVCVCVWKVPYNNALDREALGSVSSLLPHFSTQL